MPDRPSIAAAVTNNLAKVRWGAKTQQNRRCKDLFKSLMRLIGNPAEPAKQALCASAAELMVIAENAREAALTDPTDKKIATAISAEKAQRHSLTALGVKKPGTEAPMSMAEQLASRGYVPPDDDDDEADE